MGSRTPGSRSGLEAAVSLVPKLNYLRVLFVMKLSKQYINTTPLPLRYALYVTHISYRTQKAIDFSTQMPAAVAGEMPRAKKLAEKTKHA